MRQTRDKLSWETALRSAATQDVSLILLQSQHMDKEKHLSFKQGA